MFGKALYGQALHMVSELQFKNWGLGLLGWMLCFMILKASWKNNHENLGMQPWNPFNKKKSNLHPFNNQK
jgi:hypothetical protein